ncbi:MAG TPA: hypothetical protein DEG55_02530, partial [Acidaminococcaceae bacterium]|nr:hypothetical protein [Acidaminococcaceae bacterium]
MLRAKQNRCGFDFFYVVSIPQWFAGMEDSLYLSPVQQYKFFFSVVKDARDTGLLCIDRVSGLVLHTGYMLLLQLIWYYLL